MKNIHFRIVHFEFDNYKKRLYNKGNFYIDIIMAGFELDNGYGILWDNSMTKFSPKQADLRGTIKLNDVVFETMAWEVPLEDVDTSYYSFKITPKVQAAFADDDGNDFTKEDNTSGYNLERNTGIMFPNPVLLTDKTPEFVGQINFVGEVIDIIGYKKFSKSKKAFINIIVKTNETKIQPRHEEQEYVKQQIAQLQEKYLRQTEEKIGIDKPVIEQNAGIIVQDESEIDKMFSKVDYSSDDFNYNQENQMDKNIDEIEKNMDVESEVDNTNSDDTTSDTTSDSVDELVKLMRALSTD